MSENRSNGGAPPPATAAEALYGRDGPISGGPNFGTQRQFVEGGIARPDPRFADERQPARQEARGPAFDPARYTAPEGYETHPEMMNEFAGLASEFGLDQQAGARTLDLYRRATEASEQAYARSLEAKVDSWAGALPPQDIEDAKVMLNDPDYTPVAIREWTKTWASRHPDFGKMIAAWGAAAARGRRY
jgi:hypothetical protein